MTDHDDDTKPIAPHRDLGPAEPPADADITSDGPGTPPITDADITETVINVDLGDGSWSPQTMGNPVQQTNLDVTRFGGPPTKWVDGMGEVEVTETTPDEVHVFPDGVIEVWNAGKLAEASLVDADRGIERSFIHLVATGDAAGACLLLMNHLLATEATRAAAEPGEVQPAFGLGEPPLYEVAAHAVQRETALQSAEMYRRSMERETST